MRAVRSTPPGVSVVEVDEPDGPGELIAISSASICASDFPHADHTPEYLKDLEELAEAFTDPADRRRFLGDNCRELFAIEA